MSVGCLVPLSTFVPSLRISVFGKCLTELDNSGQVLFISLVLPIISCMVV